MEINGSTIDAFRSDFNQVKKLLEKKYGVTITLGSITYWDDHFQAKMTVDNGTDKELIAENKFDDEVWKYEDTGLKKGMYLQMFIGADGKKYAIEGFVPNARKYPLAIIDFETGRHLTAGRKFIKHFLSTKYMKMDENYDD